MNRTQIADLIVKRLREAQADAKEQYQNSSAAIGNFVVDDLLPEDLALQIHKAFPDNKDMKLKKSIREYKHVAAQMDEYDPILEEAIYAFQDERVVALVHEITGIGDLQPDEHLYAGGISAMAQDNFLNPHLDNSHDKDRDKWRVLNLLFYVTPDWQDAYGGHLELWPEGVKKPQITLHSRFNRLAVMATHQKSWHSVSPVEHAGTRQCVSNYYFSDSALTPEDRFHVTSFRGRPDQKLRDLVLQMDAKARMALRKVFKKGVRENPHVYKKDQSK
ncbi:2OG-Fe(II) oxygenase [Gilvibacter sp.]|uniref:2OG-Fe(II) oxygenase n=1 Tax=Gilvibacter sp. TaxID=2729997 RepID=UPI0025C6306E|nr:2OG-Fe(II) oxygenase [Gilvibacter sp.]NQX78480.1 2OG-Fe(II) oxygenase [Gilvibacter sp.]